MDYKIQIETIGDEALQEQIYREVLMDILRKCMSEVAQNEQSHNLSESLNRGTS